MKKFAYIVIAASLVTPISSYAALPTDAAPFQVIVPNLKDGLEFTVEGLWLQPSITNLDYLTLSTTSGAGNTTSSIQTVDPDFAFGFRVGLGYVFPNSGNDVQIAWTYYDNSDTDSVAPPNGTIVTTPAGSTLPSISENMFFSATEQFKANAIDLDVGQYLAIGTRLQTRLFAGLRFAQLENNNSQSLRIDVPINDSVILDISGDGQLNSKFTGIGPRLGFDTAYHLTNCIGLVGHLATALLVGPIESSTTTISVGTLMPSNTSQFNDVLNISSDDSTRIVPAFDAKLGLDYSYIFVNHSILTMEAGYQVTQYIDAVDKITPILSTTGEELLGTQKTTDSLGFQGPYLSLKWKM